MILSIEEGEELIDWLMDKGLGLGECAYMMCNMERGDSFSIALLKVFNERKKKLDTISNKNYFSACCNPATHKKV